MSMILAPYNDAMRIGQGFNSYTHEICIDGAIVVDGNQDENTQTRTLERPSQVVSYSARAVEKLSDVIQTMNVSFPHSIKKGSVTVSGSNTAIDEATFKSADINIIVTVKVTNQTTVIRNNARFVPMKGIDPGSQSFHDSYGDSYISGFIQGGEFTGIVSIKVLDRSNVDLTVSKIKARLDAKDSSETATEFHLSSNDAFSSIGSASVKGKTESHIHVSWMGGGQIKDGLSRYFPCTDRSSCPDHSQENTPWDIDSIFKAAAAFPQRVSERPQRTWAIITKYKSNRSFMDWASNTPGKTLEYDLVSSYTAELFDSFMDYKILLKYVQLVIDDPESYESVGGKDAFDTSIETLLGVRLFMREAQGRIVQAIAVLSRDPGILGRQEGWATSRLTGPLSRFMSQATGHDISSKALRSRKEPSDKEASPPPEFDFNSLIPADLWKKWLPVTRSVAATSPDKSSTESTRHAFASAGPPPSDDLNWGKPSRGKTENVDSGKSSDDVNSLQDKIDALTSDLKSKNEEHARDSTTLQESIDKLKLDHSNELKALTEEHDRNSAKLQESIDKLKLGHSTQLKAKTEEDGRSPAKLQKVINKLKLDHIAELKARDEEHTRNAGKLQDSLNKLKSDRSTELKDLKAKHEKEIKTLEGKQTSYVDPQADKQTDIDRLAREVDDAAKAAKKKQDEYHILQTRCDSLEKEIGVLKKENDSSIKEKDIEIQQAKEKQAASDKLVKEKDDMYKALQDLYDPLKLSHGTLTKQNSTLTAQLNDKTSAYNTLSTQFSNLTKDFSDSKKEIEGLKPLKNLLEQKTRAYDSLNDLHDSLKRTNDNLTASHRSLQTEVENTKKDKKDVDDEVKTLKGIMAYADLSENSLMYNCLPNKYNGWIVMIFMPYSRLALNANKDHLDRAHGWDFDMSSRDQIFQLNKADIDPTTPWTITHLNSGKRLCFLNGKVGLPVNVRDKGDSKIPKQGGHWYIGHGEAGSVTWVFKNAEFPEVCIQLVQGGAYDGREVQSFKCTNAGDANWVIIPIGIRWPERW
ncbi:hypothetical protein FHETE_7706 [Fusarium heterosporum]|uniref:Uncharacterized protein n=1 Tax=Fusarium heterosporum TaxID=42747 RepID=A0A8H5T4W3_FUSHE|nr:hypothetical protein FHETE_7706 [Fusarium heterosporum]